MGFLVRRLGVSIHSVIIKTSQRSLSTNPMPHPKDEPKEIVIKYLDGKDNGIAVLGMNRPEARNAFGRNFTGQFIDAISALRENSKLRVLVIRSLVPRIFCAGGDLRERLSLPAPEVAPFVDSLRNLMRSIEKFPAPVISAIDGPALGGGLELALACDIRTASDDTKLGLVETRLAIIPGAGGTQRLPRIVGLAKAKELIYTSKIIDGIQAHQIGLVNEVVPQNKSGDAAYQAAISIAREILPNGPLGIK